MPCNLYTLPWTQSNFRIYDRVCFFELLYHDHDHDQRQKKNSSKLWCQDSFALLQYFQFSLENIFSWHPTCPRFGLCPSEFQQCHHHSSLFSFQNNRMKKKIWFFEHKTFSFLVLLFHDSPELVPRNDTVSISVKACKIFSKMHFE